MTPNSIMYPIGLHANSLDTSYCWVCQNYVVILHSLDVLLVQQQIIKTVKMWLLPFVKNVSANRTLEKVRFFYFSMKVFIEMKDVLYNAKDKKQNTCE